MLRFLGVILLSVCVIAMPSYAAITCGSACAVKSDAHDHYCCPASAGEPSKHHHDQSDGKAPDDSKHHCAAPCCGYVAFVFTGDHSDGNSEPLIDLLPTASTLHDASAHDAIFHPPRA
jgi:hypothetical protein